MAVEATQKSLFYTLMYTNSIAKSDMTFKLGKTIQDTHLYGFEDY